MKKYYVSYVFTTRAHFGGSDSHFGSKMFDFEEIKTEADIDKLKSALLESLKWNSAMKGNEHSFMIIGFNEIAN